ncbi:hypothetical protein B5S30_g5271 [[Candida] boidinii]|nr:hypothetical protein B5S30_g5271 [[Candida] boidinii]
MFKARAGSPLKESEDAQFLKSKNQIQFQIQNQDCDQVYNQIQQGNSSQIPINTKNILNSLQTLSKDELNLRDLYGRTILHIICLSNRIDLLNKLLKNQNLNLNVLDQENHWNCLHYAIFYKNFIIAKVLLSKNNDTLIKSKDREGFTPLDLLSSENDIKKLKWIPKSIGKFYNHKNNNNKNNNTLTSVINSNEIENSEIVDTDVIEVNDKIVHEHESTFESYEIQEINIEKRFKTKQDKTTRNESSRQDWYNYNRGGSNVYYSGLIKGATHAIDNLHQLDMSSLKLNYSDESYYPSLSERISLPRIRSLKMSKNHSVILTNEPKGNIFISGLGSRGRLGLGNSQPQDTYVPIPFFKDKKVLFCDVSDDHTIVLTSKNEIYTWGCNSYGQLGYSVDIASNKLEPIEATPHLVSTGDFKKKELIKKLIGVNCSKFHSLAFTKNEIYFWGLNIGQFGFTSSNTGDVMKVHNLSSMGSSGSSLTPPSTSSSTANTSSSLSSTSGTNALIQLTPKKMSFAYGDIKQVNATDNFTIVLTDSDEIHIYMNGFHAKVQPPLLSKIDDSTFDSFKPRILSKKRKIIKLKTQKNCNTCIILYDNGDISSFSLSESRSLNEFMKSLKFSTVWKATKEHLRSTDVDISNDGSIIICVKDGSAYKRAKRINIKGSNLSSSKKYKFTKIPNLNRVVNVITDPLFSKFNFIRDDIDLIPHNIPKTSLPIDIGRLSPLLETNDRVLQQKCINLKRRLNKDNTIETDFVYSTLNKHNKKGDSEIDDEEFVINNFYLNGMGSNHEDENDDNDEDENNPANNNKDMYNDDLLMRRYKRRWNNKEASDSNKNNAAYILKFKDIQDVRELMRSEDLEYYLALKDLQYGKNYNWKIKIIDDVKNETFEFRAHKEIISIRSQILIKLFSFNENLDKITINHNNKKLFIENDAVSKTLTFKGDINYRSVLILVHLLYTDEQLDIWNDGTPLVKLPIEITRTKNCFENVTRVLNILDPMGRIQCKDLLIEDIKSLYQGSNFENESTVSNLCNLNDAIIKLYDGEVKAVSLVLMSRSAYFETLLSSRWNELEEKEEHEEVKTLNLPDISVDAFKIVLRYLYGFNFNEIFDFTENGESIPEFINFILSVLEASDLLLLDELSDICQLYIKDFINLDNVSILLRHAISMKATKLLANCIWYIYNNLDYLLFDNTFGKLLTENSKDFELYEILDDGLKWFNKLKYNNFNEVRINNNNIGNISENEIGAISINSKSSDFVRDNCFLNSDSNNFLRMFLDDIEKFNSNFMHPILQEYYGPFFETSDKGLDKNSGNGTIIGASVTITTPTTIDNIAGRRVSSSERRRRSSARKLEGIKSSIPGAIEIHGSVSMSNKSRSFSRTAISSSPFERQTSVSSINESAIDDDDSSIINGNGSGNNGTNNSFDDLIFVSNRNRRRSDRRSKEGLSNDSREALNEIRTQPQVGSSSGTSNNMSKLTNVPGYNSDYNIDTAQQQQGSSSSTSMVIPSSSTPQSSSVLSDLNFNSPNFVSGSGSSTPMRSQTPSGVTSTILKNGKFLTLSESLSTASSSKENLPDSIKSTVKTNIPLLKLSQRERKKRQKEKEQLLQKSEGSGSASATNEAAPSLSNGSASPWGAITPTALKPAAATTSAPWSGAVNNLGLFVSGSFEMGSSSFSPSHLGTPAAPTAVPVINPTPPYSLSSTPTANSRKMTQKLSFDLPSLGDSENLSSSSQKQVIPSFESILLEEQMVQEEKTKVKTSKTLEEISQEEEFERWWKEESAKVQQGLERSARGNDTNSHNNNNSPSPNSGKTRSKGSNKHTNDKGKREQRTNSSNNNSRSTNGNGNASGNAAPNDKRVHNQNHGNKQKKKHNEASSSSSEVSNNSNKKNSNHQNNRISSQNDDSIGESIRKNFKTKIKLNSSN